MSIERMSSFAALALAGLACSGCEDDTGQRIGWPQGAFEQPAGQELSFRDTARPWVIGHRGLGRGTSEAFPEDTLPSILSVIRDEGAVGVEFDVALTADEQVVVFHDPALERTTNCTGCVGEKTLAELQQCAALGAPAGQVIHPPSLAEVLVALRDLPVRPLVMVDSKPSGGDGCEPYGTADLLGRRIGDELAAAGLADTAGVQGPVALLDGVRETAPEAITLVWVETTADDAIGAAIENGHDGAAIGLDHLDSERVARMRASGLFLDTFTVNAPIDIALAATYDVDVIETDDVPAVYDAYGGP